jgi:hypothetical protein
MILTMVCWYLTNSTFGLYPSSGVSKIEELKICIPNITIHTSTVTPSPDDRSRTSFRNVVSISDCVCVPLCVCVYFYWYFGPPCVFCSVNCCVTNCHLGFSLASSVSGSVWVCVCLGLYAILVFPRF